MSVNMGLRNSRWKKPIALCQTQETSPGPLATLPTVSPLVYFNDPWVYAVEPLMPDKSKVRCQTKRGTDIYADPKKRLFPQFSADSDFS